MAGSQSLNDIVHLDLPSAMLGTADGRLANVTVPGRPGMRWKIPGWCSITLSVVTTSLLVSMAACGGGGNRATDTPPPASSEVGESVAPTTRSFPTSTGEAGATATTAEEGIQVREPPAGFTVPTLISAESECTQDRKARATLAWKTSQPVGIEQQVHVSGSSNFGLGGYLTSQTLEPQVSILYWEGLTPGSTYYWRVATRVDGGWVVVDPQRFSTESCPPFDQR